MQACRTVRCQRLTAASPQIQDWIHVINKGSGKAILPQLNAAKASAHPAEPGLDYCRALCFLHAQHDLFQARQALLEELRHYPQQWFARELLYEVNAVARPHLLAPTEVQRSYPLFALLHDALLDHTMLTWPRLLSLFKHTRELAQQHRRQHNNNSVSSSSSSGSSGSCGGGHVVECGTAGGGSAVMMAVVLADVESIMPSSSTAPLRNVYALDTYAGMPVPTQYDCIPAAAASTSSVSVSAEESGWGAGTCSSPEAHVHQLARNFHVEDRLITIRGPFEDTLRPQLLEKVGAAGIGLLHVDADWYASTKSVLDTLLPVMRRDRQPFQGSTTHAVEWKNFVQVDDYYYWHGCRRAVDEALRDWEKEEGWAPALGDVDENAVCFEI